MRPSHGVNWRTSPGRMINRDASVDACGYVRGEVPAADDDRHLHARERRLGYLTGDLVHHVSVDAEAPLPRECLAANLEHHPRPLLVRADVAGAIDLLVLARANGYRARGDARGDAPA